MGRTPHRAERGGDGLQSRVWVSNMRKMMALTEWAHLSVTQGAGPTRQRDRARKREQRRERRCWAGGVLVLSGEGEREKRERASLFAGPRGKREGWGGAAGWANMPKGRGRER